MVKKAMLLCEPSFHAVICSRVLHKLLHLGVNGQHHGVAGKSSHLAHRSFLVPTSMASVYPRHACQVI